MNVSTRVLAHKSGTYVFHHINQNKFFNIYDGLTFGRTQGNELFSSDPLVSKIHCKIYVQGMQIFVEDLGSSNKTKVNGKTIASNSWVPLTVGDQIVIGSQQLILQKREINSSTHPMPKTNNWQPLALSAKFKSFFRYQNTRLSTRLIFLNGFVVAFSMYEKLSQSQCKWGVNPFGIENFLQDAGLKCLLASTTLAFINHLLRARLKAWSWQSFLLGIVGVFLGTFVTAFIPGLRIAIETESNRFACSCMAPDPTKVLRECFQWVSGSRLKASVDLLLNFKELPKGTQNSITENLNRFQAPSPQIPVAKKN